MAISASQYQVLYPNLALFEREKGWRCGKSFISHRSKCYKHPTTGKIKYETIINPKTGRKRKVKIGLDYKEYQKQRKAAIKKQGKGEKLTAIEKRYIADTKRLAESTKKKKQRRAEAKEKRKLERIANIPNTKQEAISQSEPAKLTALEIDDKTKILLDKAIQARIYRTDDEYKSFDAYRKSNPGNYTELSNLFNQKLAEEIDREPTKKDLTSNGLSQYQDFRKNIDYYSNKEINDRLSLIRQDIFREQEIKIDANKIDKYRALRLAQKDYSDSRQKLGWQKLELFNPKREAALRNWEREGSPKDYFDKIDLAKNTGWAQRFKARFTQNAKALDRNPKLAENDNFSFGELADLAAKEIPESYGKKYIQERRDQYLETLQKVARHASVRDKVIAGLAVDSEIKSTGLASKINKDIKNFDGTIDPEERNKNLSQLRNNYQSQIDSYKANSKPSSREKNEANIARGKVIEIDKLIGKQDSIKTPKSSLEKLKAKTKARKDKKKAIAVDSSYKLTDDGIAARAKLTKHQGLRNESQPLIPNYQGFIDTYKRIQEGDITAEEIKQAQLDLRANEEQIKQDINKYPKKALLRMAGWGARPTDKKEKLVNDSYDSLEQALLPPGAGTLSYAYSFGENGAEETRNNRRKAIDKQMELWTDDLIKDTAKERKQAIAERDKAIANPKTIEDYRTLIRYKGREGLTTAQRAKYEDLMTLKSRGERKQQPQQVQAVELPANKSFKLSQTKHTKQGHDLYVASLTERVDRDKYNELNRRAKQLGGYYSRYARDGAIPGFQFRDEESARKFMGLEETQGRDRTGERKTKSVTSLKTTAERIIERNEEKLNQSRLVNTARRARMASGVEDDARAEIATAKTMLEIAEAKNNEEVLFLDRVSTATDVNQLGSILQRSLYKSAREIAEKKYPDSDDWYKQKQLKEKIEDEPITDDTIEYAEYPYPSIHKDNLREILEQSQTQKGLKLLSNRIGKKYKAIANKDREWQVKFEKPSEIEDLRRLLNANYSGITKYAIDNAKEELKDYDRIHNKLDLKTPYELRAALREFNRLRSEKAEEDPIKTRERALIGRKIEGYFPTPKPLVDKMIELADLKPGQKVLEPSAGKGNIAEAIRDRVGNDTVSTIEIDRDLSSILDQKGFNNRRDNFLNITDEQYDKIIQNPPFERLQDIDHVKKAYDLLAPGGTLVSIMSESPFFQQQKKARDFRQWLEDKNGYSEQNPIGSFKTSERSTGVNTRIVVIEKPYEKRKVNYSLVPNSNIIYFAKKCGRGYISDDETCYTNEQGKTQYTYKINPKTGRRIKIKKSVSSQKRKPRLVTRLKKAFKEPSSILGNIKNKLAELWEDVEQFIYDEPDEYRLRKPDRPSTSRTFRKPDIKTARPELVKKAIAKNPPEKIDGYLAKNLTETQKIDAGMAIGAMDRDGGFLLSSGTGTGKTRTQLTVAQTWADKGKKVLIVSKSEVLKPKWQGKNKGVTGSFKDDAEVMGVQAQLTKTGSNIKPGQIGLSTYSNLSKLKDSIDSKTVLIFDEAHAFKNADSARSKYGMEMMQKAHSVLYATATPADKPGHLDYLFRANVFNGNSKERIYDWLGLESYSVKQGDRYIKRYRNKKKVKTEDVNNRLNGLFDQMTENGNTIKREISLEGVEVGFAEVRVSKNTKQKMREIASLYKNSPSPLAKAQMLMNQRRQLETDKIPAAIELVEDAIARGRKPIVFVSRINKSSVGDIESEGTTKLLKEQLNGKGIQNISEIHGGTKQKPAEAMAQFQSGKNDVLIATIESGGTGINLDDRDGDKPRSLIILTPPFSGVENVQAAGRVWRLKTKSYPEIDYVFSNTKTDNWNRAIISNKMKSLGAVVSGETGKLSVEDNRMIAKLANSGKSPRPPKPKKQYA